MQKQIINLIKNNFLAILSIFLFLICLFNDAFYLYGHRRNDWSTSWAILIYGWMGLFDGIKNIAAFSWLANPLLFIAWVTYFIKNNRTSFFFSCSSLSLMLFFLLPREIIIGANSSHELIAGYGLGYWLWVSSAVALCLANISAHKK